MTQALEAKHLADSTLFILTAKHGQSPADDSKLKKIGNTVSGVLGALVAASSDPITGNNIGSSVTTDDVAFVWLKDQSTRAAAVALLNANSTCPLSTRLLK